MKLLLGLFVTIFCVGGVIGFNQSQLDKLSKQEKLDFASVEVRLAGDKEDLGQLRAANVSLVRDILSLKTDYAEVEKLSDSFNSYTAARKDVPAFREFDELCGKVFMQLLAKEQELDARVKKLEKGCRK